jgi:apolipoprotein N-acyltransferase
MPEEYRVDRSLEHGKDYTTFDMTIPIRRAADQAAEPNEPSAGTRYRFGVIICYEDTVPYVARNFALDEKGNKRIDWLVNISNDGWFVNADDSWFARLFPKGPSDELPQHAAICTFRAVENRLPVIRSVNTGISCLIDSLGRIHDGYIKGSDRFPQRAMQRTGLDGWFLDRLPIDKRTTFYSRHGQWLDTSCAVIFAALLAMRCGVGAVARQTAKRTRATKK